MSRVGRKPVPIPSQVTVRVDGGRIVVKGPRGELDYRLPGELKAELRDGTLVIQRDSSEARVKALHGLARALVANMVVGVSRGFSKTLEIVGIGQRAERTGRSLKLQLGFSRPIEFPLPAGIEAQVEGGTIIIISGIDKHMVGQVAAQIRSLRPPEPYKGKGIRYRGEWIRQKAGKAGAAGTS